MIRPSRRLRQFIRIFHVLAGRWDPESVRIIRFCQEKRWPLTWVDRLELRNFERWS